MRTLASLGRNTDPKVLEQSHVLLFKCLFPFEKQLLPYSQALAETECPTVEPQVQFNHSSSWRARYSLNSSLQHWTCQIEKKWFRSINKLNEQVARSPMTPTPAILLLQLESPLIKFAKMCSRSPRPCCLSAGPTGKLSEDVEGITVRASFQSLAVALARSVPSGTGRRGRPSSFCLHLSALTTLGPQVREPTQWFCQFPGGLFQSGT